MSTWGAICSHCTWRCSGELGPWSMVILRPLKSASSLHLSKSGPFYPVADDWGWNDSESVLEVWWDPFIDLYWVILWAHINSNCFSTLTLCPVLRMHRWKAMFLSSMLTVESSLQRPAPEHNQEEYRLWVLPSACIKSRGTQAWVGRFSEDSRVHVIFNFMCLAPASCPTL